jgi:hypothetical protein
MSNFTQLIHKELQNIILWVCFDQCYRDQTMNITQKKQKVYDLYHGKRNTDDMGYVDQFMKGIGVFDVFFDKIEIPSSTNTET